MLTLDDIQKLYSKYGVQASKRFGQNFLVDQKVLKNIIDVSDAKGNDVIEIGPGLGSLSLYLLEVVNSLKAYELDRNMIRVLKGEIKDSKFELIEGDFLKVFTSPKQVSNVIANIPYNITSDILFKLFENSHNIKRATLMVQKEVGMRLTAHVGTSNYGKLTVTAQHFAKVNYEFTVPSKAFYPAPKVDSAIITIDFNQVDFESSKDFLMFVKKCFVMRRKTLYNNLKQFLEPEFAREVIAHVSDNESIRPQNIDYKSFLKMFNKVKWKYEQNNNKTICYAKCKRSR
ncbi:MAG: ribosomal RNA small subunit methyltransferase A [Mycoplasmataceae bacterium]|nr:ribosomal RNA small subunit methyltransferase A [Mycoplasmataceae bacterium]